MEHENICAFNAVRKSFNISLFSDKFGGTFPHLLNCEWSENHNFLTQRFASKDCARKGYSVQTRVYCNL